MIVRVYQKKSSPVAYSNPLFIARCLPPCACLINAIGKDGFCCRNFLTTVSVLSDEPSSTMSHSKALYRCFFRESYNRGKVSARLCVAVNTVIFMRRLIPFRRPHSGRHQQKTKSFSFNIKTTLRKQEIREARLKSKVQNAISY